MGKEPAVSLGNNSDHFLSALSRAIKEEVVGASTEAADRRNQEITPWISPLSFSAKQIDNFSRRQARTGEWILHSEEFRKWLHGTERTIQCREICILLEYGWSFKLGDIGLAHVYCNNKEQEE